MTDANSRLHQSQVPPLSAYPMAPVGPDIAIACFAVFAGTIGMVLNGFLLYLSVRNKQLRRKDFIIFVLNRSGIDFVYCMCIAIFQPLGILAPIAFPYSCQIAGFQDIALACGSAAAEPVLAANRFVSVCHRHIYDKFFKKKANLYFMCSIGWILGLASAVPHVFYDSLGRVTGVLCAVRFDKESLIVTVISNYILVCVSLTLVAYFNYKIFRCVHSHRHRNPDYAQNLKLLKHKQVAKFIFVSATIPLSLQTPATIGLFVRMYRADLAPDWVMFAVTAAFATCPLINPIISALMVRPLRREWRHVFGLGVDKTTIVPIRARSVHVIGDAYVRTAL